MAKAELLFPKILGWEGGFVNDPNDKGGATNMGVTISTWKSVGYDKDGDGDIDEQDIRLLSKEDAFKVFKTFYWDKLKADLIKSQSIANTLVDWFWGSGKWAVIHVQRILGITDDGVFGTQTLNAINNYPNQEELFWKIQRDRLDFIHGICVRDPKQLKFEKGWNNRIRSYTYERTNNS